MNNNNKKKQKRSMLRVDEEMITPFFFSFSDFDCYTSKSKERANGVERIILSCT